MTRILLILGVLLEALFCGYHSTIRRTDKELSVVTTCFGFEICDTVRIEEETIKTVECYYGYRSSPYVRARLRDGRTKFLTWLWRPMYDEHEFAARVNELPRNGTDVLRVYPLWWAFVVGFVMLLFALANSFGVVQVVTEKVWKRKCDVLNIWNGRKE